MSKQDAQKARSSYHSSENAASQVNTGVTFTATGEQYESPRAFSPSRPEAVPVLHQDAWRDSRRNFWRD